MKILHSSWSSSRAFGAALSLTAFAMAAGTPAAAQSIERIDPNSAIDADLAPLPSATGTAAPDIYVAPPYDAATSSPQPAAQPGIAYDDTVTYGTPAATAQPAAADSATYKEDDLIGAAEGVFGKGAEGLAKMLESILRDQGEPNGYIVGREAGAALVVGARYGSGTLYHKVEGQRPVYWTGPSIGFDVGANAANTFVLVYNLYDTEQLYERYPAGEGQAYFVGGLNASYLRKDDVVLIPIRLGAGLRLGINAGYMKFTENQTWLPF